METYRLGWYPDEGIWGNFAVKKRKVISEALWLGLILLVVGTGISLWQSKYSLSISNYKIFASGIPAPIRIVQLTDLHNAEFGEGNSRLIDKVKAQEPDVIVLTGDLVTYSEEEHAVAVELITELSEIAPVYASLGNHEKEYRKTFGIDIAKVYSDAGAIVLDKAYVDIEIKGQPVRLGGILGYCLAEQYLKSGEAKQDEIDFLKDFQDTDRYTILLAHNPTSWLVNTNLDDWDIDCVFSGHAHGGQVRLPFIGGLYAPDLGYFPGKLEGLYHSKDGSKTLVLSRGLGASGWAPRFWNFPEIVVVDLVPAQ